jgi:hypothetical protein
LVLKNIRLALSGFFFLFNLLYNAGMKIKFYSDYTNPDHSLTVPNIQHSIECWYCGRHYDNVIGFAFHGIGGCVKGLKFEIETAKHKYGFAVFVVKR